MPADQIQYSEKYTDDKYEYRLVFHFALLASHCPAYWYILIIWIKIVVFSYF